MLEVMKLKFLDFLNLYITFQAKKQIRNLAFRRHEQQEQQKCLRNKLCVIYLNMIKSLTKFA